MKNKTRAIHVHGIRSWMTAVGSFSLTMFEPFVWSCREHRFEQMFFKVLNSLTFDDFIRRVKVNKKKAHQKQQSKDGYCTHSRDRCLLQVTFTWGILHRCRKRQYILRRRQSLGQWHWHCLHHDLTKRLHRTFTSCSALSPCLCFGPCIAPKNHFKRKGYRRVYSQLEGHRHSRVSMD